MNAQGYTGAAGPDSLAKAVDSAGLSGLRARVLIEIARFPGGILIGAAIHTLARETGASPAECNAEITELLEEGFVQVEDGVDGNRRVVADYSRLGESLAGVQALALEAPAFEVIGLRGSAEALNKLREDLEANAGPVCLAFDVASPDEFPDIWERAARGGKTIVLMPRKRHFQDRPTRQLYEDHLTAWKRKLRERQASRDNVEVRLTRRPATELRWSTWAPARAGLNVAPTNPAEGPGYIVLGDRDVALCSGTGRVSVSDSSLRAAANCLAG